VGIYSVLVKRKLSKDSCFDYIAGQKLEKGQLIKVPFGQSLTQGIVFGKKKTSDTRRELKSIKKILTPVAIITDNQFILAGQIAKEYFSSLADAIFSFLPNISDKYLSDLKATAKTWQKSQLKVKYTFQICPKSNIIPLIKQTINFSGQYLIIVPEIIQANQYYNSLRNTYRNNLTLYNSQIPQAQKIKTFNKLLSGKNQIVIATRPGNFLPFTNLRHIMMISPDNFAYQEDQFPRANARKVAMMLSKIHSAKLTFFDSAISLSAFIGYKKKQLSVAEDSRRKENITALNTKNIFDPGLGQKIKGFLRVGKNVLIAGSWSLNDQFYCVDCKDKIECSICKSDKFISSSQTCAECNTKADLICSKCKGRNVIESSKNLSAVYSRLKDEFSQFKISLVTKNNKIEPSTLTLATLNSILRIEKKIDLIIFESFDNLFESPFFDQRIKLFKLIRQFNDFEYEQMVIISKNLDDPVVCAIIQNDWRKFYSQEIKERLNSSFPPATKLIKITEVKRDSRDAQTVTEITKFAQKNIELENNYLLFFNHNQIEKNHEEIKKLLNRLNNAKFYVDPIDIN